MPPAYTGSQKAAIAQFVTVSGVKESVAAKQLKASGWKVEQAIDAYFAKSNSSTKPSVIENLNHLFDCYRDEALNPDGIGISGTMKYFGDLGVDLDEPAMLAIQTEVAATSMGELTREGFVNGWKVHSADTLARQQALLPHFRKSLTENHDYFRRVYKHSFFLGRVQPQKAVALDVAMDYWRLLFSNRGMPWRSSSTDFLALYLTFLEESWKKTVSKDMWDQTGVFAAKCMEDESLAWWSEDGAWPGVIDDFVAYLMEKRKPTEQGEAMELE